MACQELTGWLQRKGAPVVEPAADIVVEKGLDSGLG